jgi:dihydropteroate synthase
MLSLEDLARLHDAHRSQLGQPVRSFSVRGKTFGHDTDPQIMGVINLSPDSWYRESVCLSQNQAVKRGRRLAVEGAALVDIGAESTLPNAQRVDDAAQEGLLLPVVSALNDAGVLVSVESYSPEVARAALKAGAAVLNITGTEHADEMYRLAADHGAGVIICYVAGKNVREVGDLKLESDHAQTLLQYFRDQTDRAVQAGVEAIWIDPGMGFYYANLMDSAQRVRYQMRTFLETIRLREIGWPVCHALPHAFEYFGEEVRSAEAFFAVLAILGKTHLLRTHEVARVRAVIETLKVGV